MIQINSPMYTIVRCQQLTLHRGAITLEVYDYTVLTPAKLLPGSFTLKAAQQAF
jgi:hypothetical protein